MVSTVTCSKSSVSETSSQQATPSFRSSPRYPTLSRYPTPWIPHPLDTPPHESPIPQDTLPFDSKPLSPEIPYPLDTHPCPKKGHGTRDTLPPPPKGTWDQRYPNPPPPEWLTDACENITYLPTYNPLLRAVIRNKKYWMSKVFQSRFICGSCRDTLVVVFGFCPKILGGGGSTLSLGECRLNGHSNPTRNLFFFNSLHSKADGIRKHRSRAHSCTQMAARALRLLAPSGPKATLWNFHI